MLQGRQCSMCNIWRDFLPLPWTGGVCRGLFSVESGPTNESLVQIMHLQNSHDPTRSTATKDGNPPKSTHQRTVWGPAPRNKFPSCNVQSPEPHALPSKRGVGLQNSPNVHCMHAPCAHHAQYTPVKWSG